MKGCEYFLSALHISHRSWSPSVCMAGRRRQWKSPTGRCKVSGCSPAAPTWTGWQTNAQKHTHRWGRWETKYKTIFQSFYIHCFQCRISLKLTSLSSPKHPPSYQKGSVKRVESLYEPILFHCQCTDLRRIKMHVVPVLFVQHQVQAGTFQTLSSLPLEVPV